MANFCLFCFQKCEENLSLTPHVLRLFPSFTSGFPALSTPNFKSLVNITIGNGANDTQVRECVGERWGGGA